jgi:hypothetical protein
MNTALNAAPAYSSNFLPKKEYRFSFLVFLTAQMYAQTPQREAKTEGLCAPVCQHEAKATRRGFPSAGFERTCNCTGIKTSLQDVKTFGLGLPKRRQDVPNSFMGFRTIGFPLAVHHADALLRSL